MSADPAAIIAFCSVGAALALAYLAYDRDRPIHPADDPDHAPHRDAYVVAVHDEPYDQERDHTYNAVQRTRAFIARRAVVTTDWDAELRNLNQEGRA